MREKDLRPSRLSLTFTYLEAFIAEFFDQNPISQIGLIGTKDGLAEKLTELSGNPTDHIRGLKSKKSQETGGEPSLQNALELARSSLIHVPAHGSREILVIMGSLTTTDPGNIHDTISQLGKDNIRASVIGLAAEVQVLKFLSTQTKGKMRRSTMIRSVHRSIHRWDLIIILIRYDRNFWSRDERRALPGLAL